MPAAGAWSACWWTASWATTRWQYTYDYANRRIGKRVCAGEGIAACPEGTGIETKYVWSGDRLIAELDGAGDIKRVYTWLGVVPVLVTDYLTSIEGQPFERSWAVATDWPGSALRAYVRPLALCAVGAVH